MSSGALIYAIKYQQILILSKFTWNPDSPHRFGGLQKTFYVFGIKHSVEHELTAQEEKHLTQASVAK